MLSVMIMFTFWCLHLIAARATRDAWGLAGDGDWNAAKSVLCLFFWPIVLAGLFVDRPARAARNELQAAVDDMGERLQKQRDRNYALQSEVNKLERQLQLALPSPTGEGAYRGPGIVITPVPTRAPSDGTKGSS